MKNRMAMYELSLKIVFYFVCFTTEIQNIQGCFEKTINFFIQY